MTAQAVKDTADDRFLNECGLLGALFYNADAALYRAAAAICGPEHFTNGLHARVFQAFGQAVDSGLVGFQIIHWVIGDIRDDETLKEMGVTASTLVTRYIGLQFPAIAVEGAARQVKHDYLGEELVIAVNEGDTAAAHAITAEMERLSRAHLTKDSGLTLVGNAANAVVNRISEQFQSGVVQNDMAWPGSHALADLLHGFRRGRMYVIGGRPGSGKTTVGLSFCLRSALRGHGVLFFELEMGRDELTEMALCDLAWTERRRIEYRTLTGDLPATADMAAKIEALNEANHRLQQAPFLICDTPGLSIAEIRSHAMQYAQRLRAEGKRLDVVCVDHLNLVKGSSRYAGNKVAETEEISNSLKALAKELECAVVVLAQLNRGVEGRDDKRPGLSDLRWTGAVEQDADVVMFVYREAYYLSKPVDDPIDDDRRKARLDEVKNRLEIIVAKHRGGPTPVLDFFCDMGCAVVRDVVRDA